MVIELWPLHKLTCAHICTHRNTYIDIPTHPHTKKIKIKKFHSVAGETGLSERKRLVPEACVSETWPQCMVTLT